ncbi:importin-7-like [Sycon ciliatum]|uniref:importin-7-like n=1 Tax=Sycon ciliatum TaxID=27933 RepID=UPI0031F6B2B6
MARAFPHVWKETVGSSQEVRHADMDFSTVPTLLQATYGPDADLLKAAENELEKFSEVSGFPSCLFQIVTSGDADLALRQAAGIYLKNLVERHYKVREKRPGEKQPFELAQADKATLRQHIVEAVIVVPAQVRKLLEACVGRMVESDFPMIWTDLAEKIVVCLSSAQDSTWLGASLCALQLSKRYRWKQASERSEFYRAMAVILPLLRQHLTSLIPNQSEASVLIQKTIVKVFHHMIEMSLPLDILNEELSHWFACFRAILVLDVPAETLEEEEESRSDLIWWKLRRWTADTLEILFDRYGCPLQVGKKYKQFAHEYCSKYNVDVLGALLTVLDKYRKGGYVAPIVLYHCLGYLKLAVRHAASWKRVLAKQADVLVQEVVFPLLCYSDADDELWQDDPYEYIRLHYDAFEDYTNPVTEARHLVETMCSKRQGMLQRVMEFCSQVLMKTDNPRHKDGALHLVGICHESILKKKALRQIMEPQLLVAHVVPSFTAPEGFRRARACWVLRMFSGLKLSQDTLTACVQFVLHSLTSENELPVKIEAALALQDFLIGAKQAEDIKTLLRNDIVTIVQGLLTTLQQCRNEELTAVIETVINVFDEIKGVAVELTRHLVASFVLIVRPEEDNEDQETADLEADGGYKALTAMGVLDCIKNIAANYEDEQEILAGMENECLPLMLLVLEKSITDFYEEVFDLAEGFIGTTVSDKMWSLFEVLCHCIVRDAMDYFPDMCPCLHLFLTTDKEGFGAVPDRLKLLVQVLQKVLADSGDEVSPATACRLLEVAIVQYPGAFDSQAIKLLVETAIARLQETEDVKSASLRTATQQVILALMYCQTESLLQVLEQQGITQHFLAQWLQDVAIYEGIHGHKLSVLAACRLLLLPSGSRPDALNVIAPHLLPKMIDVFGRLTKLYEEQRKMENEADEMSDEEEDEEYEEESEEELDDDADDLDADDPDAGMHLSDETGGGVADDDDDDDDDLDDEYSWMETGLDAEDDDATDAYFVFVETMKMVEASDAAWYGRVMSELTAEHQGHLQEVMQLAGHRKAERDSERIKAAGGYQFNTQQVPTTFNFG